MKDTVFFKKNFTTEYHESGRKYRLVVEADITSLGTQQPYFGITGDLFQIGRNGHGHAPAWRAGGCLHDEIEKHFPRLRKYIQWHLTAIDQPMHYIANSLFWAGLQGWTEGKHDSPPNLEYLKSTCNWEGDDRVLKLLSGSGKKNNPINRIKAAILTRILNRRLESVRARFLSAMAELFGDGVYNLPGTWEARVNG